MIQNTRFITRYRLLKVYVPHAVAFYIHSYQLTLGTATYYRQVFVLYCICNNYKVSRGAIPIKMPKNTFLTKMRPISLFCHEPCLGGSKKLGVVTTSRRRPAYVPSTSE